MSDSDPTPRPMDAAELDAVGEALDILESIIDTSGHDWDHVQRAKLALARRILERHQHDRQ